MLKLLLRIVFIALLPVALGASGCMADHPPSYGGGTGFADHQ